MMGTEIQKGPQLRWGTVWAILKFHLLWGAKSIIMDSVHKPQLLYVLKTVYYKTAKVDSYQFVSQSGLAVRC